MKMAENGIDLFMIKRFSSLTCEDLVLVWSQQNYLRLLLTVRYFEPSRGCCTRDPPQRKSVHESEWTCKAISAQKNNGFFGEWHVFYNLFRLNRNLVIFQKVLLLFAFDITLIVFLKFKEIPQKQI